MSRWPAFMKRKTVCEYLEMCSASLEREIFAGRLPYPVKIGGTDHWSQAALDQAIERLANGGEPDYIAEMRSKIGRAA